MTDIYKKITELNSKYGNESSEFEEELVEHLKKKFPETKFNKEADNLLEKIEKELKSLPKEAK